MKTGGRFFLPRLARLTESGWAVAIAIGLLPLLTLGVAAGAVWLDLSAGDRAALEVVLASRLALLLLVGLLIGVLVAGLWRSSWLQRRAVPRLMADQAALIVDANPQLRIQPQAMVPFDVLAASINRLADQRDALRIDMMNEIRSATQSIEDERNRLSALMSELGQGVVVCNLDGRILLYNRHALTQFGSSDGEMMASIGLGRSIFAFLDPQVVAHGLEHLQRWVGKSDQPAFTQFVVALASGQLLRVRMAPAGSLSDELPASLSGYVLMLDNITQAVEFEARRDEIVQGMLATGNQALEEIRSAVNLCSMLLHAQSGDDDFVAVLQQLQTTASELVKRLDQAGRGYAELPKAHWPLMEMRASDLLGSIHRRINGDAGAFSIELEGAEHENAWLRVDSFSLLEVFALLAGYLCKITGSESLRLRLHLDGAGALVCYDMIYRGAALSDAALKMLDAKTLQLPANRLPLTLHEVLVRHGSTLSCLVADDVGEKHALRLNMQIAEHSSSRQTLRPLSSRPEYYDFDLFNRARHDQQLNDRPLRELSYTVFDTETTGLDPSGGDEIIQIGAVRIVNGRLLRHEYFDRLVDPRRSMTEETIAIHGITPQLLAGQAGIEKVLPAFHRFAEDTLLIAHNAAFDMRFFKLKEEATGARFLQPVLDTLLLSTVLHPGEESHRLEAMVERYGMCVIGRHTALGDAILTAEVFLRMIPLLENQGIHTLGEALEASRRSYYARINY
jgi:DNA polymerase-3 subunit epsilon